VGALRLTVLATVVAAFGIAPAALLAEEPASEPGPTAAPAPQSAASLDDSAGAGATTLSASAGTASIETSSRAPAARKAQTASASASASVTIGDFFFKPTDVTVSVGESVTWTNTGKVKEGHTVTGNGFDSGVLKKGDTYTHRFSSAGTFDYVCTIHPNMRATVTVTASTSGGVKAGGGGSGGSSSSSGEAGGELNDSGSSSGGSGEASSGGGSLPSTGLNLLLLAEIGLGLVAAGFLVRRLASS
jgi:plastocyanin